MRAAVLLVIALPVAADEVAKAQAIAKAGPDAARAAVPELIALGKGSAEERFAARDALVVAGPPALARLIGEAGGNPSLRLLLEGVSHDLGAGVVAPALPLLASEDNKVRAMAAVSLGAAGAGGEAAVKQLVTALHDKDADVRREAALAIGRIGRGAHDAIPGLIHLANDPERGCTREGLLALGMIVRDAAERDRRGTKVSPEVARALESGLAWLLRQQGPDGSWRFVNPFGAKSPDHARITSLAILAMLDSGDAARFAPHLRSGLRYLAASDGPVGDDIHVRSGRVGAVVAALCAGARATGDPECRAAAERGLAALAAERIRPGEVSSFGWRALTFLETGFAGFDVDRRLVVDPPEGRPLGEVALAIVLRKDPEARTRTAIEACLQEEGQDLESTFFGARARWYVDLKSDALVQTTLKLQREDGSWDRDGGWGQAHATACMLLCLEAAAGLAHPLTMPLPDAPQLRAAVATLRIAAQSKNEDIRAAAEQALAGFAVR
ncbi:MAG: HEAT repeat domain-containing protein [Planctomycetota bacterium]